VLFVGLTWNRTTNLGAILASLNLKGVVLVVRRAGLATLLDHVTVR